VRHSRKWFLDFIIDGVSLYDEISKQTDYISFLGWSGRPDLEGEDIKRLLGDGEPNASEGQCTIYVCPECGDIGCGAITVRVEKTGDSVSWSNFAEQNTNYELAVQVLSPIHSLGHYTFDYKKLRLVFENRISLL